MTNLINIDKLTTISNNFQINDEFKKNTIILTKLNCLTKEYQEDNIIGTFNWSNINRKKESKNLQNAKLQISCPESSLLIT